MNEIDYRRFYEQVGAANGWDFSKVKCTVEGDRWSFYEEVARRCKNTDVALDIGTGGGENAMALAGSVLLLVGIDRSAAMIEAANGRLKREDGRNVRFVQMDARRLSFPDRFFDVVSCRHSPFSASEAARVLAEGGLFMTQQVGEGDKRNLKQAFGRGQAYGERDGALRDTCIAELREAGFADIRCLEYDADVYYDRYEDLLFVLKHTPIVPDFGRAEGDFDVLRRFIEKNATAEGIRTNERRFMIVARRT